MRRNESIPEGYLNQHLLLFLLIGLLVVASRYFSGGSIVSEPLAFIDTQKRESLTAVWLSGPELTDGLYEAPANLTYLELASVMGLPVTMAWPTGNQRLEAFSAMTFAHDSQPLLGAAPHRLAPLFFRPMPINQIDGQCLTIVPGIGTVLAERIIRERKRLGAFMNQDDLLRVNGIGHDKIETLMKYVSIN